MEHEQTIIIARTVKIKEQGLRNVLDSPTLFVNIYIMDIQKFAIMMVLILFDVKDDVEFVILDVN